MVSEVNIHEAKTNLSKLLHRVMAGEEIVIAKSGVPIARLVPMPHQNVQRRPGSARGKVRVAEDFDDELPDELLAAFEGDT